MNTITRMVGDRYTATADLDITAIAKLIRADLKAAAKSGAIPADAVCRVRCERYSQGQSITVTVLIDLASTFEQAAVVSATVQSIVDRYNRVESDHSTDYHQNKFFGFVNVRGDR